MENFKRSRSLSFGCLFAFLFGTVAAQADSTTPSEKITKAASYMRPVLSICPEKVWPQNRWENAAFLFTEPQKQSTSWLWEPQSNTFREIQNSQLNGRALQSYYSFFDFENYRVTSLNLDKLWFPEQVAELGIHESFHYIGQKEWRTSNQISSRSTVYPINPFPRLFRKLTQDQMLKYTQTSDISHLEEAKYWFERWKASAPREVAGNYTDQIEGSAKYVDAMSMAVSYLGCDASESDLIKNALARVNHYSLHSRPTLDAFDAESYILGATAILAARQQGLFNSQWTERLSQGESPLELLFQSFETRQKPSPRPTGARFIHKALSSTQQLRSAVDPQIKGYNNPDYVRVEVPWRWLKGSYNVQQFLYLKQIDKEAIVMGETSFGSSDIQDRQFVLKEGALNIRDDGQTCGGDFILVPYNDIQVGDNNEVTIRTPYVEAKFKGRGQVDARGLKALCILGD